MLATTPFGTEGPSPTQSPLADRARLFASMVATLIAPGAGLFSAGRRWYTRRKVTQEYSGRTQASVPGLTSGRAGKTTSKRTSMTAEAASRNGSTAPLAGLSISRGGSLSAPNTSHDSLDSAAPECPARPAPAHKDAAGAVSVSGGTRLSSLPSVGAFSEMPEQRSGCSDLTAAEYCFARLYDLGEVSSLQQVQEVLGRHEGVSVELQDGSFEITVHRDHLETMARDLLSACPGSTVDIAYDPLTGTGREPTHIARLNFCDRVAEALRASHPHAGFYQYRAKLAEL